MDKNGKTGQRYSAEEKAAAVRMVRTLKAELETDRGTAQQVPLQVCYGITGVGSWVRQADIDGRVAEGVTSDGRDRFRRFARENRELKRPNVILKRAAIFFEAELNRQQRM